MKKNGFVLIETLIATTLIATVFTILYVEFNNINENYKKTYNNNTVDKLYAANNVKNFLLSNGYYNIVPMTNYLDITTCQNFTNRTQCENLVKTLEIKKMILLPDEMQTLKPTLLQDNNISDNLKKFIKSFTNTNLVNQYRLIIEFNDNRCATIRM